MEIKGIRAVNPVNGQEIPVWVSETALTNVVSGCLKVLETPTALKQTLMRSK